MKDDFSPLRFEKSLIYRKSYVLHKKINELEKLIINC